MTHHLSTTLRWSGCFAIALGFHIAGAAALLARWNEEVNQVANAPVIMIDLAPIAVATRTTPNEQPPDPTESKQQIEPEPTPEKPPEIVEPEPEQKPEKPVEIAKVEPTPEIEEPDEISEVKPDAVPEPELSVLPPPKPVEVPPEEKPVEKKKVVKQKKPRRQASVAAAPSSADRVAERAAAPTPGAMRDSNALPNWTSRLIAQLERHKRYPSDAQSRGDRGVVRLAFSVDRSGGVHNARVVASSGSRLLDRETLSMIERASPLPAPPDDVPGSRIAVVVPIRYNIQ